MSTCLPAACSGSPSCPLCPHISELKLRRGEEGRIKLAASRGVCLFGDILALQFRLLSNSWLFFLSIPSAGITGMTHHTWEVRNFIGCPVCHSEHEKRGQNRAWLEAMPREDQPALILSPNNPNQWHKEQGSIHSHCTLPDEAVCLRDSLLGLLGSSRKSEVSCGSLVAFV